MALKTEAIGLAIATELPLVICDIQRGGPSHRACPPRPSRPTCCRRSSAATPRRRCRCWPPPRPGDCFWVALEASRIAVKYMVPGDRALRRLPRQRRRAVEDPDRRRAAGVPGDVPHRPRGLPALHARSGDAGAALGRARHARPRAPHRRPREAGRHRQRQLRAAQPRAHGPAARGQGGGHRRRTSRTSCPRATPTATCCSWAGARPTAPSPPRCARSATKGRTHRPRPPAPPEPAAEEPRRRAEALQEGAGARDEPGPAACGCCARSTWWTPIGLQQGPGQAVQAVRDRSQDRGGAGAIE